MSSRRTRTALYVYEIPVDVLQKMCMTLDIDKGWQSLAAECGYNVDQVKMFELEYYRPHRSPTESFVLDWSVRNPTIRDLYFKLKKIERFREMRLLEPLLIAAREEEKRLAAAREKEMAAMKSAEAGRLELAQIGRQSDNPQGRKTSRKTVKPCELRSDPSEGEDPSIGVPSANAQAEYSALNHQDSADDKTLYSKLNLCNATQNAARKTSGEKQLGIQLDATKEIRGTDRYSKVVPAVENQSGGADKASKGKNSAEKESAEKVPSESTEREADFQMSTKELDDAKCLTAGPSGEIERDTAVAVLATASFTYKDLSRATDGFSDGSKIGEGAFGDVYIGNLKQSRCAVKRLKQKELFKADKEEIAHHASELKTLLRYRHENIVQLYGYAVDGDEVCLVYQYMENGSLEDRLQCKNDSAPLQWLERINILRGAACGLQYLHTMDSKYPLIHGDIKSANILLDKHLEAKLSDFGLSQHANAGPQTGMYTHVTKKQVTSALYGTRAYLPPEFASNGPSTKSDTYGFGVIIFETCTGEKAYDERRETDRFLVPYVTTIMEEQDEGEWPKHLKDSKAGVCPDEIFHLVKLGQTCIRERKKDRPVMTDVLKQLEWIQDHWKQIQADIDRGENANFTQSDYLTPLPTPDVCGMRVGIQSLNFDPALESGQSEMTPQPGEFLQSDAAIPESLRLQKMYDHNRYREELRRIGKGIFSNQSAENSDNSRPGVVSDDASHHGEMLYASDPKKLAKLEADFSDNSTNCSSGSSSSTLISTQTVTSIDQSDFTTRFPSDPNKLKTIEDFDGGNLQEAGVNITVTSGPRTSLPNNLPIDAFARESEITTRGDESSTARLEEYSQFSENLAADGSDLRKLEKLRQFDEENVQSGETVTLCEGDNVEDCTADCSPEVNSGESGNPNNHMASFFAMYEEESASLSENLAEGHTEGSEGHTEGSEGQGNWNIGQGQASLVYCGISEIEGEQMAMLMDPATGQYYAVDPCTIDPSLYHHQQLSYYTQCQADMA